MKKIVFLFAMVLIAGFVMAQTAVIDQTTVGDPNTSTQEAVVSQTGSSLVKITQLTEKAGPAEFNHKAEVKQSGGNDNTIIVKQVATGNISGTGTNTTYAEQKGKKNSLKQTQISGDWTSGGMKFTSKQVGESNVAEQFSKKTNGVFSISQDGKQNEAYQKTTGEKTGNLIADIKQVGNKNIATQLFHGEDVRNAGAEILQTADGNEAKQEFDLGSQGAFYGPGTNSSKALIKQTDNNNYAYQKQVGQGSYQEIIQSGVSNEASMWSYGNYNMAYAIQKGSNAMLKVTQKQDEAGIALEGELSKGNSVMISQDGNGSEANILQDGWNNSVEGLGGAGTFAINNNGAYLKVSQTGTDNVVQSKQLIGSETVTQVGMNNTAIVSQF
ncbi:hypothetical protein [Draconibacterium orientale]|uniref:hypothetical protein n=1 Tax=Draconibacterium orientale TaxID=1168034 RepID=UPI0029BFF490|nr:hypothetical protein [Draconibacterium orientale]